MHGVRSASEIHPKKRQFLKDNFNVRQFLGTIKFLDVMLFPASVFAQFRTSRLTSTVLKQDNEPLRGKAREFFLTCVAAVLASLLPISPSNPSR